MRATLVKRRVLLLLIVLVLGTFVLRSIDLGGKSLWGDEGATWLNATSDLSTILEVQDDKHPPGYYALVHWFVGFADNSEAALRLPSLIGSAVAVAVVFLAIRRLWGEQTALVASVLLVISPLDLWYAQEARQPALAALFVACFMYVFVRRDWVGNALGVVLLTVGLFFEYMVIAGWAGLFGIYLYPWKTRTRKEILELLGITVAAFALFIPFLGIHFWNGFSDLLSGSGPSVWYGRLLGSNPVTSNAVGLLLIIMIGGWLAAAVVHKATHSKTLSPVLVRAALLAYVVLLIMPAIDRAYSVKRILVVASPIVVAVAAYLIMRIPPPARWRWMAGLVAIGLVSFVVTLGIPKDDWRGAIAFVNENSGENDVAWTPDAPWFPGVYNFYNGKLPHYMAADPATAILPSDSSGAIWLITKRRPQDPIPAIPAEAWFDANMRFIDEVPFYRMAVRQYDSP